MLPETRSSNIHRPSFYSHLFFALFNLMMIAALVARRGKAVPLIIFRKAIYGAWPETLFFTHVSNHGLAISTTNAASMIAVKRSSILFCILLSWLFLKEGNRVWRGTGALLMFAGVLLISITS